MAKLETSYEIVITTFNCRDELYQLLSGIYSTCKKILPERIIIVDDCSSDNTLVAVENFTSIPIDVLYTDSHSGPFYAEQLGLSQVESKYALVLHSDTLLDVKIEVPERLRNPRWKNIYKALVPKVHPDTVSVLIYYIAQVDDAVVATCFSLNPKKTMKITRGSRVIGMNGIPYSNYLDSNFFTLKHADRFYKWHKIFSCDNNIYALRMDYYREILFDETFAPYWLYFDDFCARAREKGYQSYLSQDVVAFHPRVKAKDEASLSVLGPDDYAKYLELFIDRYDKSLLWTESSYGDKVETKQILGIGMQ